MTMNEIVTMLDTIATDSWYDIIDNRINLTINDFEGFDKHWSGITRELEDEEAVDNVLDWLEENADSYERHLYVDYHFGDIVVTLGFTSLEA